jgi:hypothetical protein
MGSSVAGRVAGSVWGFWLMGLSMA